MSNGGTIQLDEIPRRKKKIWKSNNSKTFQPTFKVFPFNDLFYARHVTLLAY